MMILWMQNYKCNTEISFKVSYKVVHRALHIVKNKQDNYDHIRKTTIKLGYKDFLYMHNGFVLILYVMP